MNFTQGQEIRHIAKKQGVQLNLHGDLQVPFEIPERGEWRDAQDRMKKSLQSAVFLGAHYCNFHACLNMWLELITYAGRKLSASFVDSEGQFISEILYKNQATREWFITEKADNYTHDILNRDENIEVSTRISVETDRWRKEETDRRVRAALRPLRERIGRTLHDEAVARLIARDEEAAIVYRNPEILNNPGLHPADRARLERARARLQHVNGDPDEFIENQVEAFLVRGLPAKTGDKEIDVTLQRVYDQLREDTSTESSKLRDRVLDDYLREKLSNPDAKKRRWYSEELRQVLGLVDGYQIMSHYLFYTQDPIWVAMVHEYRDVLKKYGYNFSHPTADAKWLDEAWRKAETWNDREYKEFFYAAVAAKYLEGHLKTAFNWLYGDFIKKDLPRLATSKEELHELTEVTKRLIIGFENPDARETSHAGLYFLFRYKQIYAAVKTIRRTLKTDKVMMVLDHEHVATQGIDALIESRDYVLKTPDFGKLTISCHANHPNPLQPHAPLELGDVVLYELLYNLRVTGFGQGDQPGYMVFERGGGQDPFQHSIETLRLMAQFLGTNPPTPVDKLPLEFFGMKGLTAGDINRQMQIVRDHAFEPMKDLLEIPEEEWTMLSQTAIKKGKRPEVWKKAEFR